MSFVLAPSTPMSYTMTSGTWALTGFASASIGREQRAIAHLDLFANIRASLGLSCVASGGHAPGGGARDFRVSECRKGARVRGGVIRRSFVRVLAARCVGARARQESFEILARIH